MSVLGGEEGIPLKRKANEFVEVEKWTPCSVKGGSSVWLGDWLQPESWS